MSDQQHSSNHPVSSELGAFLRAWRARLNYRRVPGVDGTRRRLKSGLTQQDVADLTGVSKNWYAELEAGRQRRFSSDFLHRLADVLRLDEGERILLFHLALGLHPPGERRDDYRVDPALQSIVDGLEPRPTVIATPWWDVLTANQSAWEWFPWMSEVGSNLIRFVFLDPRGREQLVNWHDDWATTAVGLLHFALVYYDDSEPAHRLKAELLESSPEARELWEDHRALQFPDSRPRRFCLPVHGGEKVEIRLITCQPLMNSQLHLTVHLTDNEPPRLAPS
ncbi:helix-turn-helix transcriptional regulator [Streptomyces sp. NPDC048172]|uniref:helix-turn-helix transcriptional regulator n=1 Tax=Streptomyces sp. NPDC048172 TaxID=3365505 RepID=UPI003719CBA5